MNDMECGCSHDDSGVGYCEVYEPRNVKARKEHRCCECGATIQVGDVYEYIFTVFDGDTEVVKTCLTCCRIRRDWSCGVHGGLRQTIWDATGVDYITGEIDERFET